MKGHSVSHLIFRKRAKDAREVFPSLDLTRLKRVVLNSAKKVGEKIPHQTPESKRWEDELGLAIGLMRLKLKHKEREQTTSKQQQFKQLFKRSILRLDQCILIQFFIFKHV